MQETITSATENQESRGKSAQVDVAKSGPIAITILCRSEGKKRNAPISNIGMIVRPGIK